MIKNKLALAGKSGAIIVSLLLATIASAQSDQRITLNAKTGTTTVTGDLIAFENGTYEIDTMAGVMRIGAAAVTCEGAACPPLFVMDAPIVLTSLDGGVVLSGAMRGLEGGRYIIRTATMGTMEIVAALVNCEGAGCPIGM